MSVLLSLPPMLLALNSDEIHALTMLYAATNGSAWSDNYGWMGSESPCTWAHLQCNEAKSSITSVDFTTRYGFNLGTIFGNIPTQLAKLTSLTHLAIPGYRLSGTMPTELALLTSMSSLDVGGIDLGTRIDLDLLTRISGTIPTQLVSLGKLESLKIQTASMSGSLPVELLSLGKLTAVDVHAPSMSGSLPVPVPVELSSLGTFTSLSMSTAMSGTLPTQVGLLTSLSVLCAP